MCLSIQLPSSQIELLRDVDELAQTQSIPSLEGRPELGRRPLRDLEGRRLGVFNIVEEPPVAAATDVGP